MKSIIGQVLYLVLFFQLLLHIILVALSYVLQYDRRWRRGRGAAASLELVWTVTDPPLHELRRVIPPLRIGTVSIDLAFLVLLIILYVLLRVVQRVLI
jgi:YggT family protein